MKRYCDGKVIITSDRGNAQKQILCTYKQCLIGLHWSVVFGRNHHSGIKTTTKLLKPRTPKAKVCNYTGVTVKCI